jgi:hypothetical protein
MSSDNPDPAPVRNSGRILAGVLLILVGVVLGGGWTVLMFIGESFTLAEQHAQGSRIPIGTILTATASVAIIAAGVVMIRAARVGQAGVTAGGSLVATAFWLVAGAAAAYLFGFVLCVSGI